MSIENSTIAIVSAVIAGAALVSSIVSARASARSAAASEASAQTARANLRRAALRELVIAANRCSAESERVQTLIPDLRSNFRVLATLSGNFGSSGHTSEEQRLSSTLAEAESLGRASAVLVPQVHTLGEASIEDLTAKLNEIDAALSKLNVMRENLERWNNQVLMMVQSYQGKITKG